MGYVPRTPNLLLDKVFRVLIFKEVIAFASLAGVAVSSAVVLAEDPKKVVLQLAEGFKT